MRIIALLGDIVGDHQYTNRKKIKISQAFIEIPEFEVWTVFAGNIGGRFMAVNLLDVTANCYLSRD